jgi:hypothetical protein
MIRGRRVGEDQTEIIETDFRGVGRYCEGDAGVGCQIRGKKAVVTAGVN